MNLQNQSAAGRFLTTIGISFLIHAALILFLSLNPWPTMIQARPTMYTVTLMPTPIPEPEPLLPQVSQEEKAKPVEKSKPIDKPKKHDIVEKVKKKEVDKKSFDHLQEALEEIRRKAALEEIQKRMAKREVPSPPPVLPTTPASPPPPPSPFLRESKLNEYNALILAKIKQSWTIPENILKEKIDLEAIIIIIIEKDGRIRKSWFEKKSGDALYDQMAMRAVLKADPLPPIPKELGHESMELGIRFIPD